MTRHPVSLAIAALLLGACAAPQATAPEPKQARVAADYRPRPAAQPEDPRAKLIWYVFYEDIHALSVYATPGPISSESGNEPTPGFAGTSPYFSVTSNYKEREDYFAASIAAATSFDDLLKRLKALPKVSVQEDINPIYITP